MVTLQGVSGGALLPGMPAGRQAQCFRAGCAGSSSGGGGGGGGGAGRARSSSETMTETVGRLPLVSAWRFAGWQRRGHQASMLTWCRRGLRMPHVQVKRADGRKYSQWS
jgi:hypothetical protein